MNEYAFTRACIRVAGLVMLVWGLAGAAMSTITGVGTWALAKKVERMAISQHSSTNAPHAQASAAMGAVLQRSAVTSATQLLGHFVSVGLGLYLCRRYHRLLNWLMKDTPTIS